MKHLLSVCLLILAFNVTYVVYPPAVHAQRPTPEIHCVDGAGDPDPSQTYIAIVNDCVHVDSFLTFLLNLFIIVGVLAGVYRISVGFFLINTALGDPSKLQAGREALTEAVVGLLIVTGSWALIQFIQSFAPANWFVNLT